MKKTFQWLSAMALIVMGACMSVACSSDSDGGGGTPPDNSKLVGTWVIKSISPDDGHGPSVGDEMTFNANGTFSQGRDQGTYTYDSSSGTFTAKMNSMTMSGNFKVTGDTCSGSVKVTVEGQTQTYTMTLQKKTSEGGEEGGEEQGGEGGEEGGSAPSSDVQDTRIVGEWVIVLDEETPSSEGQIAKFNANGTWSVGSSSSGTYTSWRDEKGRVRFELRLNGRQIEEGKLMPMSDGNVLSGEYWPYGNSSNKYGLCMRKVGYTYPTGGIKGRWLMTSSELQSKGIVEDMPVGEVLVFGNNNELYVEGDTHAQTYNYSGNTLTINLEDGNISGSVTFSGSNATFTVNIGGKNYKTYLQRP